MCCNPDIQNKTEWGSSLRDLEVIVRYTQVSPVLPFYVITAVQEIPMIPHED